MDKGYLIFNWMNIYWKNSGGGFVFLFAQLFCNNNKSKLIFNLSIYFSQDVAAYIKKEFDKKHNPTW